MPKIKIKKNGLMYPIGKVVNVSKSEAQEAVKEGVGILVDNNSAYIKGIGIVEQVEEKNSSKQKEANYIWAKCLLDDLEIKDWGKMEWEELKDTYLQGRVSYEIWERYVKEVINKNKQEPVENLYETDIKDFLIWSKNFNRYFVDADKVSNHLIDLFNCKTIYGKKSEIVYAYDGKIWKDNGREQIKTTAECLLESYAKTKDVNEIFEKIKRKTNISRKEFEITDINKIPLSNGVWNVKEKKIEEHSPSNNFKFIFEIEKNDNYKCPNFLRFLKETCYPEDIQVIQEWFGFNLYRRYFIKKIIILLGDKNTGKSVLLNVLTSFIGELNKTGISLQKLSSGSDFTKLSLKDKHSNIYDDLPATDLNNSGNFKMAVGDGWIAGEEKFGDYLQFRNFAKHTMAANKIPPVKDNDDMAYFERMMVIKFDNTPEKMDLFLVDKLTTKEELSGILNWSLEGLYRLLDKGIFSYNKTAEETKVIMETSGNPLLQFSQDVLMENPEGRVTKEQMFEIYSIWANEKDKQKLAKNQLSIQLQKVVKYLIDKREKVRFWANVSIKSEWVERIMPEMDRKKVKTDQENLDFGEKNTYSRGGSSLIKEQIDDLDAFSNIKGRQSNIHSIDMISKSPSNSSEKELYSLPETFIDDPDSPQETKVSI